MKVIKLNICLKCDNFQDNYPLKVIDVPSLSFANEEVYHFENGFKCSWNGTTALKIEDLPKGGCRCKNENCESVENELNSQNGLENEFQNENELRIRNELEMNFQNELKSQNENELETQNENENEPSK